MTRLPYSPNRIEEQSQELDDGFERLGSEDTPFTLRKGYENRRRAEETHEDRYEEERKQDEESNEPVTRSIPEWRENLEDLDFPFVDTIPAEERQNRAGNAAVCALNSGFVADIVRGVDFEDEDVRGKYWEGERLIEIRTDSKDFPGFREWIILAHEVGHAFYQAWTPASGMMKHSEIFRTDEQRNQAEAISERLQGPFLDHDGPFRDYRLQDSELAAQVFASRVIEPQAAERVAPAAVERLEEEYSTLNTDLF